MTGPAPQVRGYYREHADVIARHLVGRPVWPTSVDGVDRPSASINSGRDVLNLVDAGTVTFRITPGAPGPESRTHVDRLVIALGTGGGTDISITATAALTLLDQLAVSGVPATAWLDGVGGMMIVAPVDPPVPAVLARQRADSLVATCSAAAPELATTDPAEADGRVLLDTAPTDTGYLHIAPYCLVPGGYPGVVVPLHRDDVAAASAGMPLEIEPDDLTHRLTLRGDVLA